MWPGKERRGLRVQPVPRGRESRVDIGAASSQGGTLSGKGPCERPRSGG